MPAREPLQRRGQVSGSRHRRAGHEQGNHWLARRERGLDLESHEIIRPVEAAPDGIQSPTRNRSDPIIWPASVRTWTCQRPVGSSGKFCLWVQAR